MGLLAEARDEGILVGWRELLWLLDRDIRTQPWTPAQFVLDFMRAYLVDRNADWLVDPCATAPTVLPALLDGGVARRGAGFARDERVRELAALTLGGEEIRWHDDWNVPLFDSTSDHPSLGAPDLIVSMPPPAFRSGKQDGRGAVQGLTGTAVEVQGDLASLAVLSALELAPGGEAIFLLPAGFLFRRRHAMVRERLSDLGLYAHAALDVRQATRATGITFVLLMVRREPCDDTFVGQLTPQVDAGQLVKNLRRRRRGAVPALGRAYSWESFTSFDDVVARERLELLVARAKTAMFPLARVLAEDIAVPSRERDKQLVAAPNTVYLPTFLSAMARADVEQTSKKASGYYRLVLDPDQALAEYVAAMFNSEVGKALRATWAGGTTIPSIRLSSLRVAKVPLPNIKVQRASADTLGRIRHVRAQLDELERDLAEEPRSADRIGRRLLAVGQADPLISWIEGLPFPLASILWRYRADAEPAAKVEHLLRFFEATAEFFVTVLLSAFWADDDLFDDHRQTWFTGENRDGLRSATFGSWTNLGATLAAGARRLLGKGADDPDRVRMRDAFGLSSDAFVQVLTAKQLWKLLDEVRSERNADAHGGIRSRQEREMKLARLDAKLDEVRVLLADVIADVQLVQPGAGSRRSGLSSYAAAAVLTGPHQIFRQEQLRSLPVLNDELYLIDVTQEPLASVLHLAPLLRLRATPQTDENACYFFNRLDGEEAEFVSHHFEREARISERDPEVAAFLTSLGPSDSQPPG